MTSRRSISIISSGILGSLFLVATTIEIQGGQFPVKSNLLAGVAKVDITPKETDGVMVTGHRRMVHGVRDHLHAGVLVLSDGETKIAIVTLDTISAWDQMVKLARARIEKQTGVPAANIMVAASHNHSGPSFKADSQWGRELIDKLGVAAKQAAENMRMVTVGYGEDRIGFSINRRKVINGRAVVRLNPDGPNDQRVKVLRFDDGRSLTPLAVVMHAVCHPCFFTWGDKGSQPYPNGYPKMSADFPGEAQTFVEMCYGHKTSSLFLQGCAGDISTASFHRRWSVRREARSVRSPVGVTRNRRRGCPPRWGTLSSSSHCTNRLSSRRSSVRYRAPRDTVRPAVLLSWLRSGSA